MKRCKARILVVEDNRDNLDILIHTLEKQDYEVVAAEDGREGIEKLEEHSVFDLIILDWMMPVMNGIEFLHRIKSDARYNDIPVIMQSAKDKMDDIEEGITAGVYYYLTKPYSNRILEAVVRSALLDAKQKDTLKKESDMMAEKAREFRRGLLHMRTSNFEYRTVTQARQIATVIASCFPRPREVVMGFTELMFNAVEHGNLGFTFEDKKKHLIRGTWQDVLDLRMNDEEYEDKTAQIELTRNHRDIRIVIEDQGEGFDWEYFRNIDPARLDAPNGRGIYLASMDFDSIQYEGSGNRVICTKSI